MVERWDNPQEPMHLRMPPMDDNVETNAHNVRIGALIFVIWSAVMMALGIGIGVYLIN